MSYPHMSTDGLSQNFHHITESRILVVDDDEVYRDMLCHLLQEGGFRNIFTAGDGESAIEQTLKLQPDLVILDLIMPNTDGFTYCENIRRYPQYADMPILVQTGLESSEDRLRAFELGASDMLLKPINGKELIARATVHIEKYSLIKDMQAYRTFFKQELLSASAMQQDLLPSKPDLSHLESQFNVSIYSHFKPSQEIGGDIWDVQAMSDRHLLFYICDFSGHGIKAALNVFRFHQLVDSIPNPAKDPSVFLNDMNRKLVGLLPRGQFTTMFVGVLNVKEHTLQYAGAGSPRPLMFNTDATTLASLDSSGLPLGISSLAEYQTKTCDFKPGDSLLMYSDALTENTREQEHILDEARIEFLIKEHFLRNISRSDNHATLIDSLIQKTGSNSAQALDDLTLSLIKRR